MTNYKITSGNKRMQLYYSTNDRQTHFVADKKDKLYIEHRKNEPKKVLFFDTHKEMDAYVQKEIAEGRE